MLQLGVDLVEIARIRNSLRNPRFLQRVFSQQERELFSQKGFSPATIAANFAAKEAFAKALGCGVRGFALCEVSVLRDTLGKPCFSLTGAAKQLVQAKGLCLELTLTHTKQYAAAVVAAYQKEEFACGSSHPNR